MNVEVILLTLLAQGTLKTGLPLLTPVQTMSTYQNSLACSRNVKTVQLATYSCKELKSSLSLLSCLFLECDVVSKALSLSETT